MLVLGILIGGAIGPIGQADPAEPAGNPAAPTPKAEAVETPVAGLTVYNEICVSCHAPPGVGGAPALGDNDAWAARIAQGMDTLIDHALHGYSGSTGIMPIKGGRTDLSDEEIIAAVKFMVEQTAE